MIQMKNNMFTTRNLALNAMVAALYAVLTLFLPMLSYGAWQCRLSEALTLLPMIFPASIPGLTVGCLIANLLSPVGALDVVVGTFATLIAAIGTYKLASKPLLAAACPVISNGLIIGIMLSVVGQLPLLLTVLQVAAGEAVAVYGLGFLMIHFLKKTKLQSYFGK